MSLEKLRQNLVTCIKGISLLVPIFIKLIKWINNNIVKIKGGGKSIGLCAWEDRKWKKYLPSSFYAVEI